MAAATLFKAAETGARLPDVGFRALKDRLRVELVDLQQRCRLAAAFPILVVIEGVSGAGVTDTLNLLNTWMDPRWIHTHAFDTPSDEERERPLFWRYWRTLPPAGNIGLYLGGWYDEALTGHCKGSVRTPAFNARLKSIADFEQTLAADGALIVKIWLHLSAQQQRDAADTHRIDPIFGFRSSDSAWRQPAPHAKFVAAAETMIHATKSDAAPWHIVEGADDNYRRAAVLTILRDAMAEHRKHWRKKTKADAKAIKHAVKADKNLKRKSKSKSPAPLDKVDLAKTMSDDRYAQQFRVLQGRLYTAQKAARAAGLSTVIAFEGWDAAGKGGAIRRLTYGLSARNYKVVPIAAPSADEQHYHYLWRFWRALSRAGHITLFDRSWYGRVLVERVEHLIADGDWMRAYGEINAFEAQLAGHGTLLLKFWLHIDSLEQLRRFKEREETPYKRWKITPDDWHNRAARARYETAVNDMIRRTSTKAVPWHLVPANNKRYARIMIIETVVKALEAALAARKKQPPRDQ